jgi:hypothetical protein
MVVRNRLLKVQRFRITVLMRNMHSSFSLDLLRPKLKFDFLVAKGTTGTLRNKRLSEGEGLNRVLRKNPLFVKEGLNKARSSK